jgi:hypothetical protein
MAKTRRNIGLEILWGIRGIKRSEHGRVIIVPSVASVRLLGLPTVAVLAVPVLRPCR